MTDGTGDVFFALRGVRTSLDEDPTEADRDGRVDGRDDSLADEGIEKGEIGCDDAPPSGDGGSFSGARAFPRDSGLGFGSDLGPMSWLRPRREADGVVGLVVVERSDVSE